MYDTSVTVYVVDDDASVREAVGSLIGSAGLRAETFTSAQEFLDRTRSGPGCLVLDLELPGLSGLDLQQELAKADVQIPIIFLSGRADIPKSVRAMKAGAVDFLTKPIDDEVLLEAIRQGIARQQRRETLPSLSSIDDVRLEERVKERTRIARELHDTLLQSFHGLTFRFQAARNIVLRRPDEAVQALDEALERTEQAIAEGRNAIEGLHASAVVTKELAQAVTALGAEIGREMASHNSNQDSASNSARFHVVVQGRPRDLHPSLRDEVYAIARETLRNAFRHAQADDIEVEITYNASSFWLRVRDDGKGIDPAIIAEGRAGHYGVPGILERAKRIGGKLDVWTKTGAGTEVELSIPGPIAYGRPLLPPRSS